MVGKIPGSAKRWAKITRKTCIFFILVMSVKDWDPNENYFVHVIKIKQKPLLQWFWSIDLLGFKTIPNTWISVDSQNFLSLFLWEINFSLLICVWMEGNVRRVVMTDRQWRRGTAECWMPPRGELTCCCAARFHLVGLGAWHVNQKLLNARNYPCVWAVIKSQNHTLPLNGSCKEDGWAGGKTAGMGGTRAALLNGPNIDTSCTAAPQLLPWNAIIPTNLTKG